jgi:hypothetical protein
VATTDRSTISFHFEENLYFFCLKGELTFLLRMELVSSMTAFLLVSDDVAGYTSAGNRRDGDIQMRTGLLRPLWAEVAIGRGRTVGTV